AALADGAVLVTGGDNGSGPTAGADIFGATGVFGAASNMLAPRSGHTATTLADGRVLVVGGQSTGGAATASAEIYDPAANSWSNAGALSAARSGHTATRLEDGRVLIAGGSGAGGALASLEIYDPAFNSFSPAGSMSQARSGHAAAILARWPAQNNHLIDRQVIFVGGSDGNSALVSTDIYDSKSGQVSAGPALPGPRTDASAVTVLGGFVYVAGGNDGANDLSSALLISRDGVVDTNVPSLLAPRSGHFAVRLPGANYVLIAGGSAGSSAELFIPWSNQQAATGSMGGSRPGAASASAGQGLYLVAGGSGSSSSEVYGYATVDTDLNDYAPGDIVQISGSGWNPGETVTLTLHEDVDPPNHEDRVIPVVADSFGNIFDDSFSPEVHDDGVRFFLTAVGQTSGHFARTTFTDAIVGQITLDQCRYGAADDPNNCVSLGGGKGWVNGNAGSENSHYIESHSIAYRARMTGMPIAADESDDSNDFDLWMSYDTKHSDKVAIDHLTHFQCLDP
ncbi:MAG: Kelch repeat-containing protein, partial [Acidimicrobiia bacterium]